MKSINREKNNIIFTVDYRTELLSIILILSDSYKSLVGNKMLPLNNKYIYERINNQFGKYRNHKTMKLFEEIITKHKYFNYDAPVTLFLSLDDNLKCNKLNDYLFKDILDGDNLIYDFIDSLSEFAKDINFDDYYKLNENEYNTFIDELYKKHIDNNLIEFLNNFFKDNSKKLYVNAIPFNSMSCYSSFIDDKVYSNIGITQLSKEDNLYKDWELNKGDMLLVSLHEFCHAYINPLTKKYINPTGLDIIIDEDMKKFAYDDVLTIINENVVRAIVLYYEKEYLKEKFDFDYKKELELGYKYIGDILNILDINNNYSNFEDFFKSEIVNYFRKISNNSLNKYLNQDIDNPIYLFHGSPKKLSMINPKQSHDSDGNINNIANAVFLFPSFLKSTPYAFKDTIKQNSDGLKYNFIIPNDNEYPLMTMENVNIDEDITGYIYVFKKDEDMIKDENSYQYKCYKELIPIDVVEIKYKDFDKYYVVNNEKSKFL